MAEEAKKTTETAQPIDYKAEYEKAQAENAKLKASVDKVSSEIADYKRKERERMSDDDKKQAEIAEKEKYYAELEKQIAVRDYADELDDIIDVKTKEKIVQMFVEGDIRGALKEFKTWRKSNKAEIEKQIKSDLMATNPQATAQGSSTRTKAEIMEIKDPVERQRAIAENIQLFTTK